MVGKVANLNKHVRWIGKPECLVVTKSARLRRPAKNWLTSTTNRLSRPGWSETSLHSWRFSGGDRHLQLFGKPIDFCPIASSQLPVADNSPQFASHMPAKRDGRTCAANTVLSNRRCATIENTKTFLRAHEPYKNAKLARWIWFIWMRR